MGKQLFVPVPWNPQNAKVGVLYRFDQPKRADSYPEAKEATEQKKERTFTTGTLVANDKDTFTFVGKKIRPSGKKTKKSSGTYKFFLLKEETPVLAVC
jgi:hypothetical protein